MKPSVHCEKIVLLEVASVSAVGQATIENGYLMIGVVYVLVVYTLLSYNQNNQKGFTLQDFSFG